MDRTAVLKLLSQRLYPILRKEGFKGSGQTLRRIHEPVIHVFNVQGSQSGGHCYLNLGAHLSFMPCPGGGKFTSDIIQEYQCAFRGRIDPPPGPEFGWVYGNTIAAAEENLDFIIGEWRQAQVFFERYCSFPDSFHSLLSESDATRLHAIELLDYSRIAIKLERHADAERFARAGLAVAGERAVGLKHDLIEVLKSLGLKP